MQDSHLNPRVLSPFYLGSVEGVGRRGVLGGLVGDVRRRKVFPNNSGRWGVWKQAAPSDLGDNEYG